MSNCLLDIRPALADQLGSELDTWKADLIHEGWQSAVVHESTAVTGYDRRADLASLPAFDHHFTVGALPMIFHWANPDGHGWRYLPSPPMAVNIGPDIDTFRIPSTDYCVITGNRTRMPSTPAYAKTGWLNFDGLYGDAANGHPSLTEDEITDQYKRWFARRHDYSINGAQNYPLVSRLVDYFWNGVNYEGFGENCKLAHSGFPSILQLLNPDLGANPDFYELAEQHPALIYQVFTGGMIWQQLWNWGQWYEAEQHPVQSPFVGIWGSYTCDTMIMDIIAQKMKIDPISMQMWLMVDKPGIGSPPCKVINSIFNAGGTFAFDVVFKGGTFGEAADASTYKMNGPFSVLYGDPTMRFSAMTLQELTNSARLDTMQASLTTMQTALTKAQADIATIEAGGGGGGGGGPVIVVQSAIYFVTADHSRSVDVTSLVKAMRGPFSVYPGLLDAGGHPYDPFVGSQKTLRIQWTRDGVPRYVSYPDYHQTVDLTKD